MPGEAEAAAAIDDLIRRLDEATAKGVMEGTLAVEATAKALAPVGESHGGDHEGDLRRSIDTQGPIPLGLARWMARTGPTTRYGRIRELGGHIYAQRAPMLRWHDEHGWHSAKHVYQGPHPYLKPAVSVVRRRFRSIMGRRWAAAIRKP